MANDFLDDCAAKFERAKSQIDSLSTDIRTCLTKGSYELASRFDVVRDEQIWSFRPNHSVPRLLPVLIGEVLHNLRSTLDQVACSVALKNTGSTKDTYFPFGADAAIFEQQLESKGKRLPADAHAMIRAWKPYKGGDDVLWNLHDLNRVDKHIQVAPINLSTSANKVTYLVVERGLVLVLGSKCAHHMYVDKPRPSAAEIAAMKSPTAVYTLPGGSLVFSTAGCSAAESFDFLITTPGTEFQTDMRPTIDIAFKDAYALELVPVVNVLQRMHETTNRIVSEFAKRFL